MHGVITEMCKGTSSGNWLSDFAVLKFSSCYVILVFATIADSRKTRDI